MLGAADVPEMLDLVERTQPGPFLARTVELGTYLGIRRDGRLVAMAGERLHPPGFTEISAVCTDAAYRGQGLATRLVRAVAAGIRRRGRDAVHARRGHQHRRDPALRVDRLPAPETDRVRHVDCPVVPSIPRYPIDTIGNGEPGRHR